jgi:hypothetical protein
MARKPGLCLTGLKRKPRQPDRLVRLLKDYPPFTPVHVGRTVSSKGEAKPVLTEAQCFENLHQYKAKLPRRLEILRPVLAGLDINMDDAYHAPLDFVTKLHRALIVELPPLYREELVYYGNYELSDRAGHDIGLSFMTDLSMLEADVMMKAKPSCFLGLNVDRTDRDMTKYRRTSLLGLADRLFLPDPDTFCLEELWFTYLAMAGKGTTTHPDAVVPECYNAVIGGDILILLDRYMVAPDLNERLCTTWLGKASGMPR